MNPDAESRLARAFDYLFSLEDGTGVHMKLDLIEEVAKQFSVDPDDLEDRVNAWIESKIPCRKR